MNTLTPKRAAILAFLQQQVAVGQSPSLAEIAQAAGFASCNAARKHVLALAQAGLIELRSGQKRAIRLPATLAPPDLLPLQVMGRVAAGVPVGADIGLDQQLWLDRALFQRVPDYLLKVQGDSMIDDGIWDGDLVGVQRRSDAQHGQIVVARLEGEVTIKRLHYQHDSVRLMPRNPAHAPIEIPAGSDFAIEGLYCGLLRQG